MLFQDDCGGLELEDPRHPGIFLAAEPISNVCILNIGDMLQRFTNGKHLLNVNLLLTSFLPITGHFSTLCPAASPPVRVILTH